MLTLHNTSSQGSHAYAAGVAYWEHDYLNGATNSDNLVRRKDSTFTNILLPAAKAVGRKIAALPAVNGCVPGQLPDSYMWSFSRCLLHIDPVPVFKLVSASGMGNWASEAQFSNPDTAVTFCSGRVDEHGCYSIFLAGSAFCNQPVELWNKHGSWNEISKYEFSQTWSC